MSAQMEMRVPRVIPVSPTETAWAEPSTVMMAIHVQMTPAASSTDVSTPTTHQFVTMVRAALTTTLALAVLVLEPPTVVKMATSVVMTFASAMAPARTHRTSFLVMMAMNAHLMTSAPIWVVQELRTAVMMTTSAPTTLVMEMEPVPMPTTLWPVMTEKAALQTMSVWTVLAWEPHTPATMMAMCVQMNSATVTEPVHL